MNSDTRTSPADVRWAPAGPGMGDHRRTFLLCPIDHKGSTTGAEYRRGVGYVRCAVCHAARRGAK